MDFDSKIENLQNIYNRFETKAFEFKKDAVCRPGCSFCCTDVGRIDTTTLEGFIIFEYLRKLAKKEKKRWNNKIAKNLKLKKKHSLTPCLFLDKNKLCRIYDIRPFSCRQLYSLKTCGDRGPTIHRKAAEFTQDTVKEIQRLDDSGYSGHISYILHLLADNDFRSEYVSGVFNPVRIADYGKAHGILINRMVSGG